MRNIRRNIQHQFTWKRIVAAVGLLGLIYMLLNVEARDPALIIAFFTMLGIGPLATADQRSDQSDDSGARRRHSDDA